MTLIDYFNAFQVLSSVKGFTASSRSLYFAILGEFNRLQYPAKLPLSNQYLQHLSGINSTSTFDSARTALINAGAITHSKQTYELVENPLEDFRKGFKTSSKTSRKNPEILPKESRKSSERVPKDSGLISIPKDNKRIEKEKNKKEDEENFSTTSTTTHTRGNNVNSLKVQEMWFRCEGCEIPGGVAFGLKDLETLYGEESVMQAILTASQANTREKLSYPFIKKVLENQQKGVKINDRQGTTGTGRAVIRESWETQQPDWMDS